MGAYIWELLYGATINTAHATVNIWEPLYVSLYMRADIWELLYGSFHMEASIWGNNQHSARNSQHMGGSIWEPVYGSV